jgi:hypothetical protein
MEANQAPADPGAAEYLRHLCGEAGATHLRACYPMDIYRLVKAISEYEGRPVKLTRAAMERAVALYFAKNPASASK